MKKPLDNFTKTNVELHVATYEKFKDFNKLKKVSLAKLLNRSMSLYAENEEFRKMINNHLNLTIWNKNF